MFHSKYSTMVSKIRQGGWCTVQLVYRGRVIVTCHDGRVNSKMCVEDGEKREKIVKNCILLKLIWVSSKIVSFLKNMCLAMSVFRIPSKRTLEKIIQCNLTDYFSKISNKSFVSVCKCTSSNLISISKFKIVWERCWANCSSWQYLWKRNKVFS